MLETKKIDKNSVRTATSGRVIQFVDTDGTLKTKDESGVVRIVPQLTTAQMNQSAVNAVGVNASNQLLNADGSVIQVGIAVQDEGINQGNAGSINFVGAGVTASTASGLTTVTVPGSSIIAQDEGSNLTTAMTSINFVGTGVTATNSGNAVTVSIPTPSVPVTSVASKTGAVTLVASDVGLGNVNNTADVDKPISNAEQTQLNLKQNTLVSGTNIKTFAGNSLLGSGDYAPGYKKTWRGFSQAQSPSIQTWDPVGGGISRTLRSRHYSVVPFRKIRVVFQAFAPTKLLGSTMIDFIHPLGLNFQCGIENPYLASATGWSPRKMFTFNGSEVANYTFVYSATVTQGSASISCLNILGNLLPGASLFYNTTLIGTILSVSGTTGITLTSPYTGQTITSQNIFAHNGSAFSIQDLPAAVPAGSIISDPLDIGTNYVPGSLASPNFFGLHTTVENVSRTVIAGSTTTLGNNTFTCTSVSGSPNFGVGSPIFYNSVFIGRIATVVTAGSSYTLEQNTIAATVISGVTVYAQGLPYQRTMSNFLQKYLSVLGNSSVGTTTSATTSGSSTTVTLAGTSSGFIAGQLFIAAGVPDNTYIIALGTSTGGNGTVILNQAVNISAVAATGVRSNIYTDTARSVTTSVAVSTSQAGGSGYFTPCGFLIETESSSRFIGIVGDSIGYGSNEGTNGSGSYGDPTGSALGNCGWIERGLYEIAGLPSFNLCRGSDSNTALIGGLNSQYRQQLLQIMNPSEVINANVHNDIAAVASTAPNSWTANTSYPKFTPVISSSNVYMNVRAGGISGSAGTAPSTTTYGTPLVDGTCTWYYLGPYNSATYGKGVGQVLANTANINQKIKSLVPNITSITLSYPTIDTASTDSYLTTANQTPNNGFALTNSCRSLMYTALANTTVLNIVGGGSGNGPGNDVKTIDPNTYLEYLGPNGSGVWQIVGAQTFGYTNDGTHPNSFGNYQASQVFTGY